MASAAVERIVPPDGAVVIVGAGLAGLYCALRLNRPALIVTSGEPRKGGASYWAQGGVAAALGPDDSPDAHAADTLAAGAGLCAPEAVRVLTTEGPAHVHALADLGVPFDRAADGSFALGLEAAHSRARVARVRGDLAGGSIMKVVGQAAAARDHVDVLANTHAHTILTNADGAVAGLGVYLSDGRKAIIETQDVVLATGGVGGLYDVTTNPVTSLGDALAMAAQAGAVIADPEFVQFHPTAIDVGVDPAPLATEALRGDGATLIDRAGLPVVDHPLGELAPRDIVARAVHIAHSGGRGVYLDARNAIGADFPQHFPTVFAACQAAGIDPRTEPIPVAPACHYHMGGVATDLSGRSDVTGLWALGEASSTGIHGANRLASNSLLEALVFASRAATALDAAGPSSVARAINAPAPAPKLPPDTFAALRGAMQRHAGVVRDGAGLTALVHMISDAEEAHGPAASLIAARFIATGALLRTASCGAHMRSDAKEEDGPAARTFLTLADLTLDAASLAASRRSAADSNGAKETA